MTKRKYFSPDQSSIFDWIKQAEAISRQCDNPPSGSLDCDAEFRAAVSEDLKHAQDSHGRELSRFQVASRMSELAGREITASMLNNWTAEAHEKHRFPAQYLPAFVLATGGQRRAFEALSRRSGLFALPGPEALRAEIQRIEEEIKLKQAEKQKRLLFLREMEK
jgi:hypothetical protein